MDNSDKVSPIFLGLGKAFDCVNQNILLVKLALLGLKTNKRLAKDWFQSY